MTVKFKKKASWYLKLGENSLTLNKTEKNHEGEDAIRCFFAFESRGVTLPCKEPDILDQYFRGKEWHGVLIEQVAESFVFDRVISSKEIKNNYPDWVANEIFSISKKLHYIKKGYVPTFAIKNKDYSEDYSIEEIEEIENNGGFLDYTPSPETIRLRNNFLKCSKT